MPTSPFSKDFDTLLLDVLTDYSNLDSAPDVSAGSMPFIMGSVLSSMLWGLYRYQDWVLKQLFPDTADTNNLNHWGSIDDITRTEDDTDATYLNKILSNRRQAKAGGNALDFENWALDQDNSYYTYSGTTYYNAFVTIVSNPDDILGTVGVYTIPDDETIVNLGGSPDKEEELRAATETYIESMRSLGMLSVSVYASDPVTQAVTMDVTAPAGGSVDTDAIETAITALLNNMSPGETLNNSSLVFTALTYGAATAVVTVPATETTTVDDDEHIRPGAITINEV